MKVSLFVVGAPKAATTALSLWLETQCECSVSKSKEPNYFSYDLIEKSGGYYLGDRNVRTINKYMAQFDLARSVLVDCSVSYSCYIECAARISKYNPEAKIIFITRDPISRAISHFEMDRRGGYIQESFSALFDAGEGAGGFAYKQVFMNGFYSESLAEYIRAFGRSNVKVMKFEDLIGDAASSLREIADFIGIPIGEGQCSLPLANESVDLMPGVNKIAGSPKMRYYVKNMLPVKVYEFVRKIFSRNVAIRSTLVDDELRASLVEYYREDIHKLHSLTGIKYDGY